MALLHPRSALGALSAVLALTAGLGSPARVGPVVAADDPSVTVQCIPPAHIVRHERFVRSAHENEDYRRVSYPVHRGVTRSGQAVYYVITDASDPAVAATLGVNYVPKLANARGTAAVQPVSTVGVERRLVFSATVDFRPLHVLVPGPRGFPPVQYQAGAVGEPGYSPLIELPDGVVLNAPQIANASGQADKILAFDGAHRRVTYHETEGCYDDESVHYASFDASDPLAAAVEDVTYAPALNSAPAAGCADPRGGSPCAREGLIAFTNGQTGRPNPQRQGLSSALLDGLDPLNILQEVPEAGHLDYSPLWDIHLATWTAAAVARGQNTRQRDFAAAVQQVQAGRATGYPAGSAFGPSGFVVNCPVVSLDHTR